MTVKQGLNIIVKTEMALSRVQTSAKVSVKKHIPEFIEKNSDS